MTTVEELGQRLDPGNIVILFKIDLEPIGSGEPPLYFVKRGENNVGNCFYDGVEYTQLDIEASGFKWDGQGTFPQPKLSVSNVAGLLTPLLLQYEYLVGALVTVTTTYEAFLDGQPDADPDQHYLPEIYTIEQPTQVNKVFIEWRLSSAIEATNMKVPARRMLRDICNFKYRVPDGSGGFKYFIGECPYDGTDYFDENDNPTTAGNDKCSHRQPGCTARFGKILPMGAFPGISRKHA